MLTKKISVGYETITKFHSAELQMLVDDAITKCSANQDKRVLMYFTVVLQTQITELEQSPKFATINVTSFTAAKKLASALMKASYYIPLTKKRITVTQILGRNSQVKNKMEYVVKGIR